MIEVFIMTSYYFLLAVAIIILSTKFLGGLSEKVNMPQVVGALVAGVILGPSVLGVVTETNFLAETAEIGVILLMFMAGLDTDINGCYSAAHWRRCLLLFLFPCGRIRF